MNSEKVKEIKKALEQNSGYIPFINEYEVWDDVTYADILTLINELESENKKLEQHKRELQGGQQDLIKRISELEKERVLCDGTNLEETEEDNILEMFCKECKSKTLKQFAERLKEKDLSIPLHKEFIIIDNKAIEETLKEFVKGE